MFRKLCAASRYFTKGEKGLWLVSVSCIVLFFFIFDRKNILTLCASVIGVTALIFNAKGNPFGQFLIVVFSALYGMISYAFAYYGEMITYFGHDGAHGCFAWITWLNIRMTEPGGGPDKPAERPGNSVDGRHGRACHICFLIHTRRISYGEHGAEHNFCHNELCRRLADL